MSEIFRYEVPVDGEWHSLPVSGKIIDVGSQKNDVLEFWAVHTEGVDGLRRFRAFRTGEPLPADVRPEHIYGSAIMNGGLYVFHLVELR